MATAIIPCGGSGSRMGLPFSKELLPTARGRPALADIIEDLQERPSISRIVVVVRAGKGDVVDHLATYADGGKIVIVHQHTTATDAASAAIAALPLADDRCLLTLPDHLWQENPGGDAVDDMLRRLEDVPVAFLGAPISTVPWAGRAGALATELDAQGRHIVKDYAEHTEDLSRFNLVWVGAGFRAAAAFGVLRVMAAAKRGVAVQASDLSRVGIAGAQVVEIPSFTDIGEWPRYAAHWRSE